MEAIESLMETFGSSWVEKRNEDVKRILESVPGFLGNVSQKDGGRALQILFEEKRGVLKFIHTVLFDMRKHEIELLKTSLKEAFDVLQNAIKLFTKDYEPYVEPTRMLCMACIKSTTWFFTRKMATETYTKLIEHFSHLDLQLDYVVEHFVTSYREKYNRKEGSVYYIIIGAIAKYCPSKSEKLVEMASDVYLHLLKDFIYECDNFKYKASEEIKIYIDCYIDMLKSYEPFAEDSAKTNYLQKLFQFLSKLCLDPKIASYLKNKVRYLISCHMKLFANFIYQEYRKWHEIFQQNLQEYFSYTNVGALRSFFSIMSSIIYQKNDETCFLYFKNYFRSNLGNTSLSQYRMRLLIYGLGEFSILYEKYASAELTEVFKLVALKSLPFYTREKETNDDYECVSEFLKTLAQIVRYMPNVSTYQISVIVELSLYFVKRYPETKTNSMAYPMKSLKAAFYHISCLEKHYQHEFFTSFFHEAILQACSHALLIDVEIQQEIENLQDKPMSYKNYLPLWHALFKIEDDQEYSTFLISEVFNEVVEVLISFIEKLNLSVKPQDDDSLFSSSFLLQAENESDFLFFVNLIDLYCDIFYEVNSSLFQTSTVEKLLEHFIIYSYQNPMISGFYKLIEAIFKKSDVFTDCKNLFKKSTCELIPRYLSDVLKLVCGFSDELQLSCMYMVFNAPTFLIKNIIDEMLPVFKIAFNMGLTDHAIAFCALNTLEQWIKWMDYQYPSELMKNVIYYLEPYLSSEESLVESFYGVKKRKSRSRKSQALATNDSSSHEEGLEDFQNKILLFYGSLKSEVICDYIHEKSNQTNATWTRKDELKYELHFPDIRLEIQLDNFLSRVIELTKSGDLRVKISACELLHTLITYMLGKKLMDQCFDKNLCFTVLRLGCDPDDIIRNLYHPFVIQLTHYLSSKLMKDSRVPQDFLDSLFEGLAEEFRASMRDFCGFYLKEFVQWSMRQSTDTDLTNIRTIVRRITSFSLYPSNKKRLAAAVAFNYLYTILRENVNLVNVYWLEFLHAFVKSMEECDDIQTSAALGHVEKVLTVRKNVFMAKSPDRRKPPGFPDATLKGTLLWLFDQCGSTNTKCRRLCMEMFERLLPCLSDSKIFGVDKVHEVALRNVEDCFDAVTPQGVKAFLKCLDFYSWVIKKKEMLSMLSNDDFTQILCSFNDDSGVFFKSISRFASVIIGSSLRNAIELHTHKEIEEIVNLTNELTLEIFNFSLTVIQENSNHVPWSENLFLLIIHCLIEPSNIELTAKNVLIFEKLPCRLETLLKCMDRELTEVQFGQFREMFSKRSEALFHAAKTQAINRNNALRLKQFVDGLIILKKCNFKREFSINFNVELNDLFEALKSVKANVEVCKKLNERKLEYMNTLIKYCLESCEPEIIDDLLTCIMTETLLTAPNGTQIAHGEYFVEKFKEPILDFMLKYPAGILQKFDEILKQSKNPCRLFYVVDELLVFAQRRRGSVESESLADEVIERFTFFSEYLNDIESRKTMFFNINKKAVALKKDPKTALKSKGTSNDFRFWIFEELTRPDADLQSKCLILQNFTSCLSCEDEEELNNREFQLCLNQLRDPDSEAYSARLVNDDLLRFQTVVCYKILLKVLVFAKSLTIYEATIKFAAGIHKYLSKESTKDYLQPYFVVISDEKALRSLHSAYRIFMRLVSMQDRLDVLRHFLLPSLESCPSSVVIEKFYQEKATEMLGHVRRNMNELNSCEAVDRKKALVTQMACYNMFEVMFAKHEVKFDDLPDPLHVKNVIPLNRILLLQAMDLRCFETHYEDEKEITRQLHCAAVNCTISMISLKKEEVFYKFVFATNKEKKQLLWERIVDCDKQYMFGQAPSIVRKERKKLVNIKRSLFKNQEADGDSSYSRNHELASLSLLENIHAYDLNDVTVLSRAKIGSSPGQEQRLDLSFENDELNEHECMPMIVGVIMHLYNNEIASLPSESEDSSREFPAFLASFRRGFTTKNNNVRLLLFKVVCNTKKVFLHYMPEFFLPICEAVHLYLSSGNPLSYVVRDILVLFVESKFEPKSEEDKITAEKLIANMIPRLLDNTKSVYKYNLEIFESLCKIYAEHLRGYPERLDDLVTSQPDLAVQVILIFLRSGVKFPLLPRPPIVQLIKAYEGLRQRQSDALAVYARFELIGWWLKSANDEDTADEINKISELLKLMHKNNSGYCARCVYSIHKACRSESRCKEFFKYARPIGLGDEYKAVCLELFLQRIPQINEPAIQLPLELMLMDLQPILRQQVPGCEEVALKIVAELMTRGLPESDVRVYIELVVSGYTSLNKSLLEHRRLAYRVLTIAYNEYPAPSAVSDLCCKALVRALTDPAEEIQQLALVFWRERVRLPDTCSDRLLAVMELYEPELHEAFARFLCILVLELTSKSIDDRNVMFQPLTDCSFRDYEVLAAARGRRSSYLGSMAPLFAPSLASQINRFSMMMSTQAGGTMIGSLKLMATKDFSFEPTLAQFALPQARSLNRVLPDPSQNKLSRRLIQEPSTTSGTYDSTFQEIITQKRKTLQEKLLKESEARRNNAKVYRKYRIGDFPDVEITHATFVESLRQFIMGDYLACKSFAVTLCCNMLSRLKTSDKYRGFVDKLSTIFKRVLQDEKERNDFAPVVLEIVLHAKEIKVDAAAVGKICKAMDLNSLGILLLEQESTYTEDREPSGDVAPPNKRQRLSTWNKESLIQLASLYKSIGMTDVVASIFRKPDSSFSDKLQRAALAQIGGEWLTARQAFEEAYKSTTGAERDLCLDGELESMAQLGNWDRINEKTGSLLEGDYDTVWDDPRRNQLLPWIFVGQLQAALRRFTSDEDPENADFLRNFEKWMSEREMEMKRAFGEEIAVFFLCGSAPLEKARHALKCCLEQVRENWMRSSPLSANLRLRMLLKLRAMFNIDAYAKVIESLDTIGEGTTDLIKYWDRHVPSAAEDLLAWNKLVTYRLSFIHLLHEKTQMDDASQEDEASKDVDYLMLSGVKQRLHVVDLALGHNNGNIVKKHLINVEPVLKESHKGLYYKCLLSSSKYKFISGRVASSVKKKADYYVTSWEVAEKIDRNPSSDVSVKVDAKHHIFDLTSLLWKQAGSQPKLLELLASNNFASDTIKLRDYDSISEALKAYCYEKLNESCLIGNDEERGDSYAKFGRYCYDLMQSSQIRDPQLAEHLVDSILAGMQRGSAEAARYFPCLLKSELYEVNEKVKQSFASKSKDVQSWMFLSYKDQILSYLNDRVLKDILLPIIQRIADDYPYAVAYDYNQLPDIVKSNRAFEGLKSQFYMKKIEGFIEGLHYVCQPELYLKCQLQNLLAKGNFRENVDTLLTNLYGAKNEQLGTVYKLALNEYKADVEKLKSMDIRQVEKYVQQMSTKLQLSMKKRLKSGRRQALQLKDYSLQLTRFSSEYNNEIEIPGQYEGSRKPMPQYHIKIAKFDRFVRVMDSKCNPIKISLIGNDAKSYSYLVKCGEDLRQDQRLQQIFKTTNKTLDSDVNCRRRYLSINTYHVLPLSNNLGLIQWVDNTRSLREFVEFSMRDKNVLKELSDDYARWIQKAGKSADGVDKCYKEALVKYSSREVIAKMAKLTGQLDRDLLKKTFVTLSPSLECFMSLRDNFVRSFATMCAIHWLTGVGDRHLENLLIDVKSGECWGIDFGLAFGTGIDQSIPELVPFRLTSQIVAVFKPFDETALFGITMTHVLAALRKERGPLTACLDVFIHEPLDWTHNINKNIEEPTEQQDLTWVPQNKIDVVKKKINGIDPAKILMEELSDMHRDEVYYPKYKHIVSGADYPDTVRLKKEILTPEEQVQCLLELAKDSNLLGRMYGGWSPFV